MTSSAAPLRTAMIVSGLCDHQFRDKIWSITSSGFNNVDPHLAPRRRSGNHQYRRNADRLGGKYVGPRNLPETLKSLSAAQSLVWGFRLEAAISQLATFKRCVSVFVRPPKEIHNIHDMFRPITCWSAICSHPGASLTLSILLP